MDEDEISYKVIGAAIEVHKTLGGQVCLKEFTKAVFIMS